jgi:hypothetical protein
MTLLYRLAEWHALAKLRMHRDSTLTLLESVTTSLCRELRRFRDITCGAFETVELEKEATARTRRQAKAAVKSTLSIPAQGCSITKPAVSLASSAVQPSPPTPPKTRKKKELNISTYKFHALPDYVRTIRMFGTTDSYSTQTVRFFLLSTDKILKDYLVGGAGTSPHQTIVRKDEQATGHPTNDPT